MLDDRPREGYEEHHIGHTLPDTAPEHERLWKFTESTLRFKPPAEQEDRKRLARALHKSYRCFTFSAATASGVVLSPLTILLLLRSIELDDERRGVAAVKTGPAGEGAEALTDWYGRAGPETLQLRRAGYGPVFNWAGCQQWLSRMRDLFAELWSLRPSDTSMSDRDNPLLAVVRPTARSFGEDASFELRWVLKDLEHCRLLSTVEAIAEAKEKGEFSGDVRRRHGTSWSIINTCQSMGMSVWDCLGADPRAAFATQEAEPAAMEDDRQLRLYIQNEEEQGAALTLCVGAAAVAGAANAS